ncbi:hypothetical protein EE612_004300 [Oryza sativa]|uniref:Uncharacterized protein n=1 Tax=Oryza glaberrima TaxID=4538 RepID=I1NJQ0_ORYGL|nr:hypothetical protein EE612_004300 [Oryza sativa]KAB8082423.1 hypothetical protein EE612_004300 [Oryza sativa]
MRHCVSAATPHLKSDCSDEGHLRELSLFEICCRGVGLFKAKCILTASVDKVIRWILCSDLEVSRFFLPLIISMTTMPKL